MLLDHGADSFATTFLILTLCQGAGLGAGIYLLISVIGI
jgi:hypothetical protein